MIVLRCTQRLLKSSSLPVAREVPPPTTPLGEWYANAVPLPQRGRWVVMYTSSQTLVTVLVPGRALGTTLAAFRQRTPLLQARLGVPVIWIERQRARMAEVVVARTTDRRVLGRVTDLSHPLRYRAQMWGAFAEIDWDRLELELAGVRLSLLQYDTPHEVLRRITEHDPQA